MTKDIHNIHMYTEDIETVTIPKQTYRRLLADSMTLWEAKRRGVEDWEGWMDWTTDEEDWS